MSQTKTLGCRIAVIVFLLACLVGVPDLFGYDEIQWAKIFDFASAPENFGVLNLNPFMDQWGFQPDHPKINPSPFPERYMSWNNPVILEMYDRLHAANRPLSMMLTDGALPLSGANFWALSSSIAYLSSLNYQLDYVWMDFELGDIAANDDEVREIVKQVRDFTKDPNTKDPNINQARIGNYGYFPVSNMAFSSWPDENTSTAIAVQNNSYNSTKLNVAMPNLYPYEYYEIHATSAWTSSKRAPNKRSALFWAPLEMFSNAHLNLPDGHEIIPFINDFIPCVYPCDGYSAPQPTHEDNAALLKHIRLRGADGYYIFATGSENEAVPYANEDYRSDMYDAWASLDWLFAGDSGPTNLLNMTTSKTTGLQWSGVTNNNGAAVLVSNLGNSKRYFQMPDLGIYNPYMIDGFYILPGEHRMEMYQVPGISVYISGPAKGTNSGTYTWCANVSGRATPPYTYDWRYSYDGVTYTNSFGTTQCRTAQLPLDFDLYLKVTVTDQVGKTATDYHVTINLGDL